VEGESSRGREGQASGQFRAADTIAVQLSNLNALGASYEAPSVLV
jgi:hypothetical protein